MVIGSGRERTGELAREQASSVNHHWNPLNTQGSEASPLTAPEEASPTGGIGESQGTSSCRVTFIYREENQDTWI